MTVADAVLHAGTTHGGFTDAALGVCEASMGGACV